MGIEQSGQIGTDRTYDIVKVSNEVQRAGKKKSWMSPSGN